MFEEIVVENFLNFQVQDINVQIHGSHWSPSNKYTIVWKINARIYRTQTPENERWKDKLKVAREKWHLTYRDNSNNCWLSSETMVGRREGLISLKYWDKKKSQPTFYTQ